MTQDRIAPSKHNVKGQAVNHAQALKELEQEQSSRKAYAETGRHTVSQLGRSMVLDIIRESLSEPKSPDEIRFALGEADHREAPVNNFQGDKCVTLAELGERMEMEGRTPCESKAELPLITSSTSFEGRHRDVDTEAISLLLLDSDNAGDLKGLRKVLGDLQIAHIWADSVTHDPGKGVHKYHIIIPLADPIIPDGADETDDLNERAARIKDWKRDVWVPTFCKFLGILRGLDGEMTADFDVGMSNPMQPFYFARRLPGYSDRTVTTVGGRCLDLKQLLSAPKAQPIAETNGKVPSLGESRMARALRYLSATGYARQGEEGDLKGWQHITNASVGFDLTRDETLQAARAYNEHCEPPFSESDLIEKAERAARDPGRIAKGGEDYTRGYLLRRRPKKSDAVKEWEAEIEKEQAQKAKTAPPLPQNDDGQRTGGWSLEESPEERAKLLAAQDESVQSVRKESAAKSESGAAAARRRAQEEKNAEVNRRINVKSETGCAQIEMNAPDCTTMETPMNEIVHKAISALANEPNVYAREGKLCWYVDGRLEEMTEGALAVLLSKVAIWIKYQPKKEPIVTRTAPRDVIQAVLAARNLEGVRPIRGVTSSPMFTRDGLMQYHSGYDPSTQIYLSTTTTLPPVGESRAQAVSAVQDLMQLLKDFPFKIKAEARCRGVWLSALLTRLARGSIDQAVPMFIARGNSPGTGKGLLFNLIGQICDGNSPGKTAYQANERDMKDEIVATLYRGPAMSVIDNIPTDVRLSSQSLATVLTTTTYDARGKGGKVQDSIPALTIWAATGNGLKMSLELQRRSVVMELETSLSMPWARQGLPRIERQARAHRERYLAAALTCLRTWHVAGRPRIAAQPMNGFEEWDDTVRQCVLWLASLPELQGVIADPIEYSLARENDERLEQRRFMSLWQDLLVELGKTECGMGPSEALRERAESVPAQDALRDFLADMRDHSRPSSLTALFVKFEGLPCQLPDGGTYVLRRNKAWRWFLSCVQRPTVQDPDPTPAPASPAQAPASPAQAPASPAQAPASPAQAPASPAQAPASPAQAPASPAQAPASPAQAPASPAQAPASPAQAPASPAQAPASPAQAPASPAQALASPAQAPASPAQAPEGGLPVGSTVPPVRDRGKKAKKA